MKSTLVFILSFISVILLSGQSRELPEYEEFGLRYSHFCDSALADCYNMDKARIEKTVKEIIDSVENTQEVNFSTDLPVVFSMDKIHHLLTRVLSTLSGIPVGDEWIMSFYPTNRYEIAYYTFDPGAFDKTKSNIHRIAEWYYANRDDVDSCYINKYITGLITKLMEVQFSHRYAHKVALILYENNIEQYFYRDYPLFDILDTRKQLYPGIYHFEDSIKAEFDRNRALKGA